MSAINMTSAPETLVNEPVPIDSHAHARRARLAGLGAAWALPALTVATAVFFSLLPSTASVFLTTANLQAIAQNQAILAIVTLGVLIPLVCEEFDLSVGANVSLCGVLSASVMASGASLAVAILVALGVGIGVGVINGLLVVRSKVSGVIITLGTTLLLQAAVQAKTNGRTISANVSERLVSFCSGTTLGVPTILYAVAALAVAAHFVLEHTPVGRRLYMFGANREAARLVGLRGGRLLSLAFVLAGAMAGVAGILQVGRLGSAEPTSGDLLTLPALAAAFLSAASIKPGRFSVGGAITAITFLAVLNGGLNLSGAQPYVAYLVNGLALIIGVSLAAMLARREAGVSE
jgi:ribose transport system permease protein